MLAFDVRPILLKHGLKESYPNCKLDAEKIDLQELWIYFENDAQTMTRSLLASLESYTLKEGFKTLKVHLKHTLSHTHRVEQELELVGFVYSGNVIFPTISDTNSVGSLLGCKYDGDCEGEQEEGYPDDEMYRVWVMDMEDEE
eukprot:Mrub_08665.p1 GENE.Mrub_08665~~Mrub_08665.p1  ORF type:complete len:143 (+),score=33.68 Mrub_08665:67-495(+)